MSQFQDNTLTAIIDQNGPVKVFFFGSLEMRRVHDPELAEEDGIQIASMLDLLASKLKTVQVRVEAKDCRDIAAMLEAGLALGEGLAAAIAVYGKEFNGALSLKERPDCGLEERPWTGGTILTMTHPLELQKVAKRVVWFKSPEETLKDTKLFLAHVMT